MVMRIDDDNDELAEGGRQVGDIELCLGGTIIHCDQKYLLRRCHHCFHTLRPKVSSLTLSP